MKLKEKDKIKIITGGEATIISKLGEGGQGIVYKVIYYGKEYALKWYHNPGKPAFYNNLKTNIEKGSPDPCFLWPLFLTEKDNEGCYGYLMELCSSGYYEFKDFLLAKTKFSSVEAMIEAGIKICAGFRKLHNKGYSYQDLNDGGFFINPSTGDVLICDLDNVAPSGINTGVLGKCRYMAPEIVTKKSSPDAQSDRFSLSLILFLLFFNNHPLEGEQITSCPCMTEKHEKKLYGTHPVFIYDSSDASNRPVNGIHVNVINLWQQFPDYVRDIFQNQFCRETLFDPSRRKTEKEWLEKVLFRMRHELMRCPICGNEIFADVENKLFKCSDCDSLIQRPPVIQCGSYKMIANKGKKTYGYMTDNGAPTLYTCTGVIVESKKTVGILGLENKTTSTWILTTKSGNSRPIAPNETAPLLVGNTLSFGNGKIATII